MLLVTTITTIDLRYVNHIKSLYDFIEYNCENLPSNFPLNLLFHALLLILVLHYNLIDCTRQTPFLIVPSCRILLTITMTWLVCVMGWWDTPCCNVTDISPSIVTLYTQSPEQLTTRPSGKQDTKRIVKKYGQHLVIFQWSLKCHAKISRLLTCCE